MKIPVTPAHLRSPSGGRVSSSILPLNPLHRRSSQQQRQPQHPGHPFDHLSSPSSPPSIRQSTGVRTLSTRNSGALRSTTSLHMSPRDMLPGVIANSLPAAGGNIVAPVAGVVTLLLGGLYWKYRGAINYRLKLLREESWIFGVGVTMERIDSERLHGLGNDDASVTKRANAVITESNVFANLNLLELNPDFEKDCQAQGWSVYSLGDYLSSLRPKQLPMNMDMKSLPDLVKRELEAGLAAALLKALGPNLGRALLPLTGLGAVQNKAQSLASDIVTKWFLSDSNEMSETNDKGGVPISLLTLLAASDLNARFNSGKDVPDPTGFSNLHLNSIEKMMAGEVAKGPSFACIEEGCMFPQDNFVVSRDFDSAIAQMEGELSQQMEASGQTDIGLQMARKQVTKDGDDKAAIMHGDDELSPKAGQYDPDDRRLSAPVPINERLFPDLYLGYGKAICSHTKREVLRMRLISVLLNRLGSNYHKRIHGKDDEIFTVQMNEGDRAISTPDGFIQALLDTGHHIEAVPTTHLTTFGINLCVKEKDGSWSNIPLAVFLESGYEDRNGRVAPAMMPHSGLDMYISGPLAGKRGDGTDSTLRIQHFNGIEGFCGWQPNMHPEVPFNVDVETSKRLINEDVLRAARVAGLYACVLNGLSSELQLPFGGYGLTAVCNDSAALVQQCLYNEATIYPMTSVGRYLHRTMRYAQNMADKMSRMKGVDEEVHDLTIIADAMKKIPSDLNASPANAENAARRMLATLQPNLPFNLAKDSKHVMESILREEEESKVFDKIRTEKQEHSMQAWK